MSNSQTLKNAVFYSKSKKDKGQLSWKLAKLVQRLPFGDQFMYVCIDPDPITKKVNNDLLFLLNITHVPTIYVQGTKLEGAEAIDWVQREREEAEMEMYGQRQQPPPPQDPWGGGGGQWPVDNGQWPPPSISGGNWPQPQQPNNQWGGNGGGYQQPPPPQYTGGGFQSTGRPIDPSSRYPGLQNSGFNGGPGVGGIGARRPPMQGQPTGNGRMPIMPIEPYDARPPFDGNPNISAGNGGIGGANFDSQFADPYSVNCPQVPLSLIPVETRNNNPNLDVAVQQYEQYRDASVYVPPRPC